jgi:hypothetical protein
MRRLALAMTLACVLSGVVRAGEIPTTGAVGEIPSTGVRTTGEIPTSGVIGEIHTPGQSAPEESSTVLTVILIVISIVP